MKDRYDYLVIGSGLAGLYTALLASAHGTVGLVTKDELTDSNSYNAQGGIAAVSDTEDLPENHYEDTMVAGRGLCDSPSVDILVHEGPERIRELIAMGMHFDVTESGELALGLEGGHHRRRILHAGGDATGRLVTSFVLEQVKKQERIEMVPHCSLVSLIVSGDNVCSGVRCWNFREDREAVLRGKNTVLACGGAGAIYGRSTNPSTTTGDGIAIAYEAGCAIEDMEFIQFHPTAICKEGCRPFLVSEAVRGEGAHLYNLAGERFMLGAHELNELAPRDVVAQMIDRQIRREGKGYVYLSLKHLDPDKVKSRFPTIYAKCLEYGIDMCDRIPVAPAAHYTVGGVRCDENGATGIGGLYVCGEIASTGIMGANRLASNSLIECMVFAGRVVRDSLKRLESGNAAKPESCGKVRAGFRDGAAGLFSESGLCCNHDNGKRYAGFRKEVSRIVDEYAGIVRDGNGLRKGLSELDALEKELTFSGTWLENEVYSRMCMNLIVTARLIMEGALYRKESRGCLFRSDYPHEDPAFRVHTLQRKEHPIESRDVK